MRQPLAILGSDGDPIHRLSYRNAARGGGFGNGPRFPASLVPMALFRLPA